MSKNGYFKFLLPACVGVIILGWASLFTVHQTEQALILRFGEPIVGRGLITAPGLYVRLPFVENVVYFDNRILDLESGEQELLLGDNQRLVVDAFLRYKIVDPLKFYQTVRSQAGAANQLGSALNSTLRRVLGNATVTDVVRDHRDALMASILEHVNQEATHMGVFIIDTRIRRADFPPQISDGVFRRMQAERQREAAEYRAQGNEISQRIKAKADRDATVLIAEAQRQAETIRGKGDAERNHIFAQAIGKDIDFFEFYRLLQAYEVSLKGNNTKLLLSPTAPFFKYLGSPSASGEKNNMP